MLGVLVRVLMVTSVVHCGRSCMMMGCFGVMFGCFQMSFLRHFEFSLFGSQTPKENHRTVNITLTTGKRKIHKKNLQ